jgi:hypothetical protein
MAFARRDYFYRNAVEQKYQNLSQLFFRSFIVCLVGVFYLQANTYTGTFGNFLAAY